MCFLLYVGFDRLMAILCQVDNMKDVIAFPKSFTGRDLLMEAPSKLDSNALKEYHIVTCGQENND